MYVYGKLDSNLLETLARSFGPGGVEKGASEGEDEAKVAFGGRFFSLFKVGSGQGGMRAGVTVT